MEIWEFKTVGFEMFFKVMKIIVVLFGNIFELKYLKWFEKRKKY